MALATRKQTVHPVAGIGEAILYATTAFFYPVLWMWWMRNRVEFSPEFRELIRLPWRIKDRTPHRIDAYRVTRPVIPHELGWRFPNRRGTDAAHVLALFARDGFVENSVFSDVYPTYVEVGPGLWLEIRFIRATGKWRFGVMRNEDFHAACPIGTHILVRI